MNILCYYLCSSAGMGALYTYLFAATAPVKVSLNFMVNLFITSYVLWPLMTWEKLVGGKVTLYYDDQMCIRRIITI